MQLGDFDVTTVDVSDDAGTLSDLRVYTHRSRDAFVSVERFVHDGQPDHDWSAVQVRANPDLGRDRFVRVDPNIDGEVWVYVGDTLITLTRHEAVQVARYLEQARATGRI